MGKIDERIILKDYIQHDEELNDPEKNKILLHWYPWLAPRNAWSGKKITDCMGKDGEEGYWPGTPESHPNYTYSYTILNEFPTGWRMAFGLEMLDELNVAIANARQYNFYPIQIKEKYGSLRFYVNWGTQEIYDIIHKYERKSYYTCIRCGRPATKISRGWISPWCDEHSDEEDIDINEYYAKEEDDDASNL